MKKTKCPVCNGEGEVPIVPIYMASNLELAEQVHKLAMDKWQHEDGDNNLVALAFELKSRIHRVLEDCKPVE